MRDFRRALSRVTRKAGAPRGSIPWLIGRSGGGLFLDAGATYTLLELHREFGAVGEASATLKRKGA